ncbi:MAG: hypothetical protein QOK29_2696, partial [Rhodospirillaceae bacterium]|nr:hypothetical protein [Rhodospirillaceae bacterium]
MRELRAASAFADRPDARGSRFQPFVDAHEASGIEFDSSLVEADIGGIRNATDRHEKVAAFDLLLACSSPDRDSDCITGKAMDADRLGVQQD